MNEKGELAKKLQKTRKEKGITYQKLAEQTGLSIATVESIFQGKQENPTLTTLQKICDILELSIDKLINREDLSIKGKGDQTVFSHIKHDGDISVPARLIDSIEDPDGLMTIAYLEAAKDFHHTLLPYYTLVKIMLVRGVIKANGKKLKPMEMATFEKSAIKKGLKFETTKGSRGILCLIPGIKIKR